MKLLDLFSGYGGFHLALEQAGFEFDKVYFSEIDIHAIANYTYNFPKAIYAGPIQSVSIRNIDKCDIITFGWPCQDNSIAGKRKGQSGGTRSGLLSEAVRCIAEHQPRHFFAENVPGLLSVNKGIDYVEAVKVLCLFNESLPQYDVEMQLLNTKWFLPQNRERLFFVGHLRNAGSRKVFPLGENNCRADEGTGNSGSDSLGECARSVRTITGGEFRRNAQLNDVTACVNDRGKIRDIENANCLDASYYKGYDNHGARTLIKENENRKDK